MGYTDSDKIELLTAICKKMRSEAVVTEKSMQDAKDETTHTETRQEGKYDTRAIEAGYLAGAQELRLSVLLNDIKRLDLIIEQMTKKPLQNKGRTQVGSIILVTEIFEDCSFPDETTKTYFLLPCSAGNEVMMRGVKITSVSTKSNFGRKLLGLCVGQEFELETPKGRKTTMIEQIY